MNPTSRTPAKNNLHNKANHLLSKETDKHLVSLIYGLEVENTAEPVVVSAFTGVGKTAQLCEWLANNYRSIKGNQYIIAFKEIRLLAEFVCSFNKKVRARSNSEYAHLGRYVQHVFEVDDALLDSVSKHYKDDVEMLTKVMNFLDKTNATTSLKKDRLKALHKARIIFTTHESIQNLGCAQIVAGKHIIYDEAPANCIQVHKLREDQNIEEHINSYLYDAKCIDVPKQASKRIGKFLSSGIWKASKDYHLSLAEIESLNSNNPIRKPVRRFCSDLTHTINGFENGDTPLHTSPHTPNNVELGFQVKPNHFTHFFVSYLDLDSFKAKSVTILTACPEGTSIALLERLSGKKFIVVEGEASKARRVAVEEATQVETLPEGMTLSCSKANSKSKAYRAVVNGLIADMLLNPKDCYAIAHGWQATEFIARGLSTCKLGQTGSNSFRDKHAVVVVNLPFSKPEDAIIGKHIFGENWNRREQMVMASDVGQSIMRSALRKIRPEKTQIVFFDIRVEQLWNLFLKGIH